MIINIRSIVVHQIVVLIHVGSLQKSDASSGRQTRSSFFRNSSGIEEHIPGGRIREVDHLVGSRINL